MYKCHEPSKSWRLVNPILHNPATNYKTPDLFWRKYSLSRIFTDLILHNYRSNQSALMTRLGTDLRHQYGIFGGKSQTSFTRNATRGGSEEGRLFSQARHELKLTVFAFVFCILQLGFMVLWKCVASFAVVTGIKNRCDNCNRANFHSAYFNFL